MPVTLASIVRDANEALIVEARLDDIARFFTEDYVVHLTGNDMSDGHDGIRKVMRMYRSAFPDIQVNVEILVETETRVGWQRTMRANHEGAFRGFPATGRLVVWRDMVVSEFRDGLISEEWLVSDLAEQLLRSRKG